jgi:hypothetical protein
MASKQAGKDVKGTKGDSARERRLIEALRANLVKRKAQARARKTPQDGEGA